MSDTVDGFRAMKDLKTSERKVFGVPCPVCKARLPKAFPKILLPRQLCRAHNPHYRDERPKPSKEEWNAQMVNTGWTTE